MVVAILSNHTVINAAIFDNIETAQSFLASGVWPEADAVLELPEGYGIGDTYDGEWHNQTFKPEPEPEPETPAIERIAAAVEYQTIAKLPNSSTDYFSETDYQASPQERIAAALEISNVISMEDANGI